MKRVLAFVDYYLPGSKGGGPAVSVSRRAASLEGKCEFFVFTRDRDLGDDAPYSNVSPDEWNGQVFYASPSSLSREAIMRVVREVKPDVVYLNSFFSRLSRSILWSHRSGLLGDVRVVVAPRGELDAGALSLKAMKKRAYLSAVKVAGLCKRVRWHATSSEERDAIRAVFRHASIEVVAESGPSPRCESGISKQNGDCSFVFLSRVSRKKNLLFLVNALSRVKGSAQLHVYGPIEDERYWAEVEAAAKSLPSAITMTYHGAVSNAEVPNELSRHHVFVLPTLGENFCHVIAEALASGMPCLISDKTPWNDGAGMVVPLNDQLWVDALQGCIEMTSDEYAALAARAAAYYAGVYSKTEDFEPVLAA